MRDTGLQTRERNALNPDDGAGCVHVPMRTCLACRSKLPKYEMTRLARLKPQDSLAASGEPAVNTASLIQHERQLPIAQQAAMFGEFVVDSTQVFAGRGYYVCDNIDCRTKLSKLAKGNFGRRSGKNKGLPDNAGSKRG